MGKTRMGANSRFCHVNTILVVIMVFVTLLRESQGRHNTGQNQGPNPGQNQGPNPGQQYQQDFNHWSHDKPVSGPAPPPPPGPGWVAGLPLGGSGASQQTMPNIFEQKFDKKPMLYPMPNGDWEWKPNEKAYMYNPLIGKQDGMDGDMVLDTQLNLFVRRPSGYRDGYIQNGPNALPAGAGNIQNEGGNSDQSLSAPAPSSNYAPPSQPDNSYAPPAPAPANVVKEQEVQPVNPAPSTSYEQPSQGEEEEDTLELGSQEVSQEMREGVIEALEEAAAEAEEEEARGKSSRAVFSNFTITSVLTVLVILMIKL